MDDKIINRIKKMFALANNEGAAKGEAENAMRMANKLMEKYELRNIDLHTNDTFTIEMVDASRNVWVRHLYHAVAPVYSCQMFNYGKNFYTLVGTESNLVTACIVIDGLVKNIKRASKGKDVRFANGAMLEVAKQCREIIANRRVETEKVPGTELSLVDIYDEKARLLQEFMDEKFNLTKGKRSNMSASSEGRAYGKGLNPHANLSNRRALN